MARLKPKRILVAGDLIADHNLARLPGRGRGFHAPCSQTLLTHSHGGAWYVAEMLKLALGGLAAGQPGKAPEVLSPERISLCGEPVNHPLAFGNAFSVWQLVESGKDKVCRVGEFLGCQGPPDKAGPVPMKVDPIDPEVLVLDDLGTGFASNPAWWPMSLKKGGAPRSIIVKASASFDGPLWQKLLAPSMAERTTVVVSARALRSMGAKLSRALSWDQVVEDLNKEFTEGQSSFVFGALKRIMVLFGAEGVAVFSRLPRVPQERKLSHRLHFERLIYDPECLEGDWWAKHKGATFGGHSVLTAAVVRHEIQGREFPLFFAICRALEGMRAIHATGAGPDIGDLNFKASEDKLKRIFKFSDKKEEETAKDKSEPLPEDRFRAAYPREILDSATLPTEQIPNRCILTDVVGESKEFIAEKAEEIVRVGVDKTLKAVPRAKYGDYVTVDREEIERINSIRNLIMDYRDGKDPRPLSIAVFGQPGSGKSFAIKQLAEELFGKEKAVLEFNLSQFESVHDLHEALHQVRDKSLEGKMPFVFWDEFDSRFNNQPLGWLKEFLAPMQDAKFQAGGVQHPLGRAIFVFAGGTCTSFDLFATEPSWESKTSDEALPCKYPVNTFKDAKVPDFISRLRGYVNIKGPNPVKLDDNAYLIRRAMLLRSMIERYFGDSIIDPYTKKADMSPGVLTGLLRVVKYLHGARSMEAVISMSHLRNTRSFGLADLPPREVLDLHLSPDFMKRAEEAELVGGPLKHFVEVLAEEQYEGYRRQRAAEGQSLDPYGKLDEAGKEKNLVPARLARTRLAVFGYRICRDAPGLKGVVKSFTAAEKKCLAVSEHKRWMRERLVEGYVYGDAPKNDKLRLNPDIQQFEPLVQKEKRLDNDQIDAIWRVLKKMGLVVVKERLTPGGGRIAARSSRKHGTRSGRGSVGSRRLL